MKKPQFDIRIDATGRLTVEVSGVSGEECTRLVDMIVQIVGKEESRELTKEFFAPGPGVRITTSQQNHVRR